MLGIQLIWIKFKFSLSFFILRSSFFILHFTLPFVVFDVCICIRIMNIWGQRLNEILWIFALLLTFLSVRCMQYSQWCSQCNLITFAKTNQLTMLSATTQENAQNKRKNCALVLATIPCSKMQMNAASFARNNRRFAFKLYAKWSLLIVIVDVNDDATVTTVVATVAIVPFRSDVEFLWIMPKERTIFSVQHHFWLINDLLRSKKHRCLVKRDKRTFSRQKNSQSPTYSV